MRREFFLLLAASLVAGCQTSRPPTIPAATAPVWQVTSGENVVYLGGTIHILRAVDLPPPEEFDTAFAAADELVFETDPAALTSPSMLGFIMREGVLPPGQTLESHLTPEAWQSVVAYCESSGVSLATMGRFRPWMFTMNVTVLELVKLGVSQEGIDFIYARRAAESGKPVRGLETLDQHLAYLTGIGVGHESEMVLSTLHELARLEESFTSSVSAWRNADLAAIDDQLSAELRRMAPNIYEKLLVERNQNWLPEIEAMLRSPETELVLVGVAHLAGPDGLLDALAARGHRITPVSARPPAR